MFLSCPLFEVLYEGTRGGGKTDALIMDFCQHVGKGYGADWKGVLFRQTFPQLTDVISKTKKWIPQIWPDAKYNASNHTWTWVTGEQLLLRQFSRADDYWNFHGHEYPWIGWEELCNWATLEGYTRMMSCCRSSNPEVPRKIRATTNPYGPGHNVVKHRFRLPQSRFKPITDSYDKDGDLEPPRVAIFGYIQENKKLLSADPGYISRMKASARNEAEKKAWVFGSWDIVAGGMFDDVWEQSTHVLKEFDIPPSWSIRRSFDWGSSKPFSVGWWARSDGTDLTMRDGSTMSTVQGDLFRIKEWYGWTEVPNEGLRMLAIEVSKGIIERELDWGIHQRVRPGPADNSIFDVQNGVSIALDMQKPVRVGSVLHPGTSWTRSDKSPGSRKTGWERMRKYFKSAKRPASGVREFPGIFVVDTCEQFLRTIPTLPRDEDDLDDVDTDVEDHIADESRYLIQNEGIRFSSGGHVGLY